MTVRFGTDGIRGIANADLTPELALRVGRAAAAVLAERTAPDRPVVVDALCVGIAPTPAVASIARHIGAAAGVVISASHNPIEDNGIKIFAGDGYKLDDDVEATIAEAAARDDLPRPTHGGVGRIAEAPELVERYTNDLVRAGGDLSALTVVVDGAYGAAYDVGPATFERLGATVIPL